MTCVSRWIVIGYPLLIDIGSSLRAAGRSQGRSKSVVEELVLFQSSEVRFDRSVRVENKSRSLATILVSRPSLNSGRSFRLPFDRGVVPSEVLPTIAPVQRRRLPGLLASMTRHLRLPVCLGVVAGSIVLQQRKAQLRAISKDILLEFDRIRNLTMSNRITLPVGVSGSLKDRLEALGELRERRKILSDSIAPKLGQLYGAKSEGKQILRGLSRHTTPALVEFDNNLTECIEMSGLLLDEYASLDQTPPPDFRTWPLTKLHAWYNHMTVKRSELRKIAGLYAQLGRQRMDWALPEWSVERMQAHSEKLAAQVQDMQQRRERDELLGKLEAILWRRGEDRQVASFSSLSISELRELLADLR